MKNQTQLLDVIDLEKEVEAITPLIRQGFSRLEGPSDRVIRAIHDEAVSHVFSARRRSIPHYRVIAAAASLVLLMGGGFQYHLARRAGMQAQTLRLVLHIGAPNASNNSPIEGTTELANQLLSIQGLDEDSFFKAADTEVL
jgi:hypothetical protein